MYKAHKIEEHESMEEEMIPDEFSDEDVEDDVGFEEVEEKFQPRDSISSRGGAGRTGTERYTKTQRATNFVRHLGDSAHEQVDYEEHDHRDESYDPANQSESVITEIVENKIVYLDSDKDPDEEEVMAGDSYRQSSDRNKQIQEYLDIDKEDYVNKDEYADGPQDEPLSEEQQNQYDALEAKKQELSHEKLELEDINSDLERQLDSAMPILDSANSQTDTLVAKDIRELKTLSNPAAPIKSVYEAVSILLGSGTSFRDFKILMGSTDFINKLQNYDKENISDETLQKLDEHIEKTGITDTEKIRNCSAAAHGLGLWVLNIRQFADVYRVVRPKMDRLDEAREILNQKMGEISKIEKQQAEILNGGQFEEEDIKHAGLQTEFDGKKHILRYEVEDEAGNTKFIKHELTADHYPGLDYDESKSGEEDRYVPRKPDHESLFYISNQIKQKDQSKKFVLWETNEMRNHWDERLVEDRKVEAVVKTNSHQWGHEPSNKLLSVVDTIKSKGRPKNYPQIVELCDEFAKLPKKDHTINNIFLQSNLQERFEKQNNGRAPLSHSTFNKAVKEKAYEIEGRPRFEGIGNHVQNINAGRARTFYSSNIF
jgi:hypothetical protein